MKIANLQNGQVVRVKTGMAGRHEVVWSDWRERALYVQRNNKGEITVLSIQHDNWAEYNPKYDYQGNGLFTAEDYYMEIEGLE